MGLSLYLSLHIEKPPVTQNLWVLTNVENGRCRAFDLSFVAFFVIGCQYEISSSNMMVDCKNILAVSDCRVFNSVACPVPTAECICIFTFICFSSVIVPVFVSVFVSVCVSVFVFLSVFVTRVFGPHPLLAQIPHC